MYKKDRLNTKIWGELTKNIKKKNGVDKYEKISWMLRSIINQN